MTTATLQRLEDSRAEACPGKTTRWRRAQRLVRQLWRGLREWCGDSAYERYLRATQKGNSASCPPPLSQEEFYVEQLNRRYSRPNRCC